MTEANTNLPTTASDGFDDFDDRAPKSIIRGIKLKFTNNAEWLTATGEVIAPDREFLVIEIIRVTQKWVDGMAAETRILAPDEPFPDIEQWNAEAPRSEWREAFGRSVGPWQNSYVVYLLDPRTMAGFTFPTSTSGGFRAIQELKDSTRRARMLRGANVFPLVTLDDVFMPTQFGGRRRPCFKIKKFVALGGAAGSIAADDAPKKLEHQHERDDRAAPESSPRAMK
jgi:hypothetical protein